MNNKKIYLSPPHMSGKELELLIDAFKSNLQIHGKEGVSTLVNKVKINGPRVLWHGAMASVGGSFLGHYPWFFTYNYLQENVPKYNGNFSSVRSKAIGFCSGTVSDVVSNSVRVIKINRQTESSVITYRETVSRIIKSDGIIGLMTRGLKTKILPQYFSLFSIIISSPQPFGIQQPFVTSGLIIEPIPHCFYTIF